ILKVGHHGSKKSLSYKEAQILQPKISCISVGKNNTYGHPAQELLDVLDEVGSQVFRTDFLSDVTCIFNSEGITVKPHSARVEACER
ncbi:MAG: hypothetical protein IJV62_04795, partial [Eggerthellaceae bacterium]|nr:hypothetical protein [Eggerthellaceae bacterium]